MRNDDNSAESGAPGYKSDDGDDSSIADQPTIAGQPVDAPEAGAPRPSAGTGSRLAPRLDPGVRLGGYVIVRLLGKGGMGEVYEVDHPESGRRIALKVLSDQLADVTDRKRFLREGRLAAQVSHPNSVYIYGTEEIDGTPVIAMELVSGGTLKERLKAHGPLPSREAVDTILQVVDGLAAAGAKDVLHRDVKPANCFVDTDGTVKVGDFGLSISTRARDETHLTTTGSFIGTPVFASPEQVHGKELDVRSDIYSVGATLYYLLTGRPPFEADGAVQLIAKILQEQPPSPHVLNPDVPKGLARVVMGLLEKDPAKRTGNYNELKKALEPFSSQVAEAAGVGPRLLAGVIDSIVAAAAVQLPTLFFLGFAFATSPTMMWIALLASLFYYGLLEGLWGAAVGKAVLGLRVGGPDQSVPGIPRAAARVLVFQSLGVTSAVIAIYGFGLDLSKPGTATTVFGLVLPGVLLVIMFSTARRHNGYAGLHDLVSNTRVVCKGKARGPRLYDTKEETVAPSADAERIGPYVVAGTIYRGSAGELLAAYDPALQRPLWIHRPPEGSPAVPASRHGISRRGRLRWLNGKRGLDECWDAYEAPDGVAFLDLRGEPREWTDVRDWIADLAEEIESGVGEGSLPEDLSLERLWITSGGRLKILDFPAPRAGQDAADTPPPSHGDESSAGGNAHLSIDDVGSAQRFLCRVALSALAGRVVAADAAPEDCVLAPYPLHARSLLNDLSRAEFVDYEQLTQTLHEVRQKADVVTLTRRLAAMVGAALLPTFMVAFAVSGMVFAAGAARDNPELTALNLSVLRMRSIQSDIDGGEDSRSGELRAMQIYISAEYGDIVSDPAIRQNFAAAVLVGTPDLQRAAEAVAQYPDPTVAEVEAAKSTLQPFLDELPDRLAPDPLTATRLVSRVSTLLSVMFRFIAMAALVSSLIVTGGVVYRLSGIAVINARGEEISRLRSLVRAALTWSPILLVWALNAPVRATFLRLRTPETAFSLGEVMGLFAAVGIFLLVVGAAYGVLNPRRGFPDRLVGSWLVPR